MTSSTSEPIASLSLRLQKKIASKLAKRSIVRQFVDDDSAALMDGLRHLTAEWYRHQGHHQSDAASRADKMVKSILKTLIKIGVLNANGVLANANDQQALVLVHQKLHQIALAVMSFYEMDFCFNYHFLAQAFGELRGALRRLTDRHLSDKSRDRIEAVVDFYSQRAFLDAVYAVPPTEARPANKPSRGLKRLSMTSATSAADVDDDERAARYRTLLGAMVTSMRALVDAGVL